MELVPIIYSSLFFVFSLLALVVVGSLICSKFPFCGVNKKERKAEHRRVKKNTASFSKPTEPKVNIRKKKEVYKKSKPKVEREFIDSISYGIERIDRVESSGGQLNFAKKNTLRYSIVNTAPKRRSRKELYQKFSEMSIEYSQSA